MFDPVRKLFGVCQPEPQRHHMKLCVGIFAAVTLSAVTLYESDNLVWRGCRAKGNKPGQTEHLKQPNHTITLTAKQTLNSNPQSVPTNAHLHGIDTGPSGDK